MAAGQIVRTLIPLFHTHFFQGAFTKTTMTSEKISIGNRETPLFHFFMESIKCSPSASLMGFLKPTNNGDFHKPCNVPPVRAGTNAPFHRSKR